MCVYSMYLTNPSTFAVLSTRAGGHKHHMICMSTYVCSHVNTLKSNIPVPHLTLGGGGVY